jgi:outer membrane receptor protein involved in Fe transport
MSTRLHRNKKLYRSLLATAIATTLASAVAVPTVSWAQTADATLRGKAAANSEVTAKNVATGATRHTKADEDGSYTLVGLSPGTYRVDAGPGTETVVTLSVASTATLDLAPGTAAIIPQGTLEEITAKSTRLVEVKTSEIGTTVPLQLIETVPQVTRNFLEFADTVPGMVFSVDSSGNTSLRGGAMNNSSVNVYIDGIGQKNYVKEGGVSGQFFTQGNPFPQLAIGEYKVITSNYKAEYDQISSAAVIAETKSGTNEFHGDVFAQYTNDGLRAETPSEIAANKKTKSNDKEYGIAIGGPIIQDQMHFFVTYEGKKYTTPVTVVPGVAGVTNLLPASVAAQLGPSDLPFTENLYFAKIDWEVSDYDRLELSGKVRKEDAIQNIGVAQAESQSIDTLNDDTRLDARWKHSANRWFNDLLFTYEDSFNSPSTRGIGNGSVYTYQPKQDATIIDVGPGSPLSTQNKGQRGPGVQDDLTFNDLHWMGDHTLKMGAKYKKVTLTAQDAENINPQFYYDVNPTGTAAIPYKAFFTNSAPGLNPEAKSKNSQFGVYFQDDWVATDRLTLNLGVRWDYEKTPSYLGYVTPANVVAALNGPNPDPTAPAGQTYAQALAKGGINVNDYISNGNNRKAITNEWQPRLGFSFDLNADQRHVVFGGIGRSYDRTLFDYLQLEETKAALSEFTINFNVPERPCTVSPTCVAWDPKYLNGLSNLQALVAASNAGKEVDAINNNAKVPYSDQFSLGIRNRLGDWNTSATVARILSKDGFVFTLGNRYPSGAFWMNGGQPWGNGVPGFGAFIIGSNGIETKNTELLLSAEKPYTEESRWGATVAYTFTDATQDRDIKEHYSFDEANIQQYPFITSNAAAKHRLVATGTYGGPWGLLFSGKLTLATPTPVNDIACYLANGVHFGTGSNCTPIAATPPNTLGFHSVDFDVKKVFEFANIMSVSIRIDLLNAFNWKNYSDTLNNWGGNGVLNPNPVVYNYTGNISGVPRTLRVQLSSKF